MPGATSQIRECGILQICCRCRECWVQAVPSLPPGDRTRKSRVAGNGNHRRPRHANDRGRVSRHRVSRRSCRETGSRQPSPVPFVWQAPWSQPVAGCCDTACSECQTAAHRHVYAHCRNSVCSGLQKSAPIQRCVQGRLQASSITSQAIIAEAAFLKYRVFRQPSSPSISPIPSFAPRTTTPPSRRSRLRRGWRCGCGTRVC